MVSQQYDDGLTLQAEVLEHGLQVRLRATTDGAGPTAFYVDDVSFESTCERYPPYSYAEASEPFLLEVLPPQTSLPLTP